MGGRRRHHPSLKMARKRAKDARARRKRARRERISRDEVVTHNFGMAAHQMCGRKRRYGSEGAALVYASRCVAHGAPALRAYKCPYCDGWHLTSQPRTQDDV